MLESPDVLGRGLRHAWRNRVGSQLDYSLRDGKSAPPVQIDIKIIDSCNLRCKMCAQWGENGYNFTRPTSEITNIVPLESYQRMVDEVSEFQPWIYIWGGEPFLYPDLMPLLRYMKERGLTISIVTNGTKLKEHARELVEMGQDVMMLSVDGPRETHDNIRGYQGAFDDTVNGIRLIQQEKARLGRSKPYIIINSVVTSDNEKNLQEVFELGEDLEIDLLLAFYGWFQTPESGMQHTKIMQETFGVNPWSWRGWVWSVNDINPDTVIRTVRRIKQRKWSFPHVFIPGLEEDQIAPYYREHQNSFGHKKCVAPWVMMEIMPNGDVVTCRDYPDLKVGNIKDGHILDIWNNDKIRNFRSLLSQEGGLLPVCKRCQGLMGW
jgi:radical SAM protein with 4Fe4S-binding SPASM domain